MCSKKGMRDRCSICGFQHQLTIFWKVNSTLMKINLEFGKTVKPYIMSTVFVFFIIFPLFSFANDSLCQLISSNKSLILHHINKDIREQTYTINQQKRMVLHKVYAIPALESNGVSCQIKVKVSLTLKQKTKKNAKGTGTITGAVNILTLAGRRHVCVSSNKFTKISLNSAFEIGATTYRWIANKSLPKKMCFPINVAKLSSNK